VAGCGAVATEAGADGAAGVAVGAIDGEVVAVVTVGTAAGVDAGVVADSCSAAGIGAGEPVAVDPGRTGAGAGPEAAGADVTTVGWVGVGGEGPVRAAPGAGVDVDGATTLGAPAGPGVSAIAGVGATDWGMTCGAVWIAAGTAGPVVVAAATAGAGLVAGGVTGPVVVGTLGVAGVVETGCVTEVSCADCAGGAIVVGAATNAMGCPVGAAGCPGGTTAGICTCIGTTGAFDIGGTGNGTRAAGSGTGAATRGCTARLMVPATGCTVICTCVPAGSGWLSFTASVRSPSFSCVSPLASVPSTVAGSV
jgi:hypothetical protein